MNSQHINDGNPSNGDLSPPPKILFSEKFCNFVKDTGLFQYFHLFRVFMLVLITILYTGLKENFLVFLLSPWSATFLLLLNFCYIYDSSFLSTFSIIFIFLVFMINYHRYRSLLNLAQKVQSVHGGSVFGLPRPLFKLLTNMYFMFCNIQNKPEMHNIIRNCVQFLMNYYDQQQLQSIMNTIFELNFEAQSGVEEYISRAEGALKDWSSLRDSELITKTNRVFRCLIFAGCVGAVDQKFNKRGMQELLSYTDAKGYKFNNLEDMLFSVSELVILYLRVGYECFADKSMRPIYIRNRMVKDFVLAYDTLMEQYACLPCEEHDIYDQILEKSRELIAISQNVAKSDPILIGHMRRDLIDKYTKLLKEHNVSTVRKPPFTVLLYGPPGIGKSTVTQQIARHYQMVVNKEGFYDLEFSPKKNVYTLNSNDDYFSGYKGASQWCMVLDDIARESPYMVKSGQTSYLESLITIINCVGVATNQAALEDKGTIPLIPKLVVGTTNTKHLNAHLGMSEPTAVLRRLPIIIEPVLKSEYFDQNTGTMKKVDSVVNDAWYYRVDLYKIIRQLNGELTGEYVPYNPHNHEDGLITSAELFQFLRDKIVEHERSSQVMMDSLVDNSGASLCEHGVPSFIECKECAPLEAQSLTDYIPDWNSPETTMTIAEWYFYRMLEVCYYKFPNRYLRMCAYVSQFSRGRSALRKFTLDAIETKHPGICSLTRKLAIVFGTAFTAKKLYDCFMYFRAMYTNPRDNLESQANFWSKPEVSTFMLPRMHKPNNLGELSSTIKSSMFKLCVVPEGEKKGSRCYAFCLAPNKFVTVGHIFDKGDRWNCIADVCSSRARVTSEQKFVLCRKDCHFLDNDMVVFEAILLPRKCLFKFLGPKIDTVPRKGLIVHLGLGGTLVMSDYHGQSYGNASYKHAGIARRTYGMRGHRLDRRSVVGDCGSLYLSFIKGGYVITGMHVAGSIVDNECLATQISQEVFSDIAGSFMPMSEPCEVPMFARGNSSSGYLQDYSTKGVHQWCDSHGILIGSFAHGVSPKSRVRKTDICNDLCLEFNYKLNYQAPVMKPFERDGIWYNPYTLACEVQGNVSHLFNYGDILHIARCMVSETTKDSSWLGCVENKSLHVAINGEEGNSYVNSLPMNTSGGFLYPGAKRKYFEGDPANYVMNNELERDYIFMRSSFATLQSVGVLMNGTLKDEPRKASKVATGQTRVFTASDVAFSIIVREQYLGIAQAVMSNNIISECAVSMDHGTQWGIIYDHVTKFGKDRIIAGDYKNYDKRMPALFIRAAFYVLDSWRAVVSPLVGESRNISNAIATELSFPYTNLNRDVIQFYGGNSSGHPLTAILNSIANSLFMRFAYWKLGYDPLIFKRDVSLMTLGDDNIMGSRLDDFNHVNISRILGQHGVIYTMADKEARSVPFINIDKADFLKRGFKEVGGHMMGPLANDSIMKSLCLFLDNGEISENERMAQCYRSARREWCLYGKDVFDKNVAKMLKLFNIGRYSGILKFLIVRDTYDWETTLKWIRHEKLNDDDDKLLHYRVSVSF